MHEELRLWRHVIIDDIVYQRNVDPTGSDVCDDEELQFAPPEFCNVYLPRCLEIHTKQLNLETSCQMRTGNSTSQLPSLANDQPGVQFTNVGNKCRAPLPP
jgi:hypothetical protein